MRDSMNLVENAGGLIDSTAESRHLDRLVAKWPVVEPGMFVQLNTWGGDVWAEISGGYFHDDPKTNSVTFWQYDKYGVERKMEHAYYREVRKFANRNEINFKHDIISTREGKSDGGYVVKWPAEASFETHRGRQIHPTLSKEESRAARDAMFYGIRPQ